ncbi:hypothetical protein [Streptomyces scopuliridis]|uniref:hypothetical protein n=1 Tax=Streptomyces scopuliridis TaxID=452529 RepID=UPI003417BBD5
MDELDRPVAAFLEEAAAVQQMREHGRGRALRAHLGRPPHRHLDPALGVQVRELSLTGPYQPDRDGLQQFLVFLQAHRDAFGTADLAPAVPAAEEHGRRGAVEVPASVREEAASAAVQGADDRAEQRGLGEREQGRVLPEPRP